MFIDQDKKKQNFDFSSRDLQVVNEKLKLDIFSFKVDEFPRELGVKPIRFLKHVDRRDRFAHEHAAFDERSLSDVTETYPTFL